MLMRVVVAPGLSALTGMCSLIAVVLRMARLQIVKGMVVCRQVMIRIQLLHPVMVVRVIVIVGAESVVILPER